MNHKLFRSSLLAVRKRFYYSHTVIPGVNRINKFPLQADIPKDAPPIAGYNFIMNRLANIALNVTEKQMTKALHVFPESSYVLYLGNVSHFDVTGLSAITEDKQVKEFE
jgi:hypothetical protein